MKNSKADKLEIFELITGEPCMIDLDQIQSLSNVIVDLSNKKCFLELDRFDRRIFKFGDSAPNLKSFILRTGKLSITLPNQFDENRFQAIKLPVNETLVMHSTHEVDLVRIKAYLQELFPFIAQHMQGT